METTGNSGLARLALVLSAAPLAACASWHSNETWSFALTRDAYDPEPGKYDTRMFDADHPRSGGVESLWLVGIVLLPVSLTMVADACVLPITLPHDAYVACRHAVRTDTDEKLGLGTLSAHAP